MISALRLCASSRRVVLKHAKVASVCTTPRHFATFTLNDDYNDAVDGNFNLILHPDNDIQGTQNIVQRIVPAEIRRPPYVGTSPTNPPNPIHNFQQAVYPLKSEESELRAAGKLASSALTYIASFIEPGTTPDELDRLLHEWILEHDCYPSPLGYHGFPKSCCISVNNIVAHGIPDSRPLEETDMLTLDLTLYTRAGFHSDTSRTFCLYPDSKEKDSSALALQEITRSALKQAIDACGPGVPFREIGRIIEQTVEKESSGTMSIVKQLTGHGIGRNFHMRPWILHYVNNEPGEMKPGHCFTIEPAVVASRDPSTFTWLDKWTISTENGARAAQMEHTILITRDGADVLTA